MLRHNDEHQALLLFQTHEWVPVLYDGLASQNGQLLDAAKVFCLSLQAQVFPEAPHDRTDSFS